MPQTKPETAVESLLELSHELLDRLAAPSAADVEPAPLDVRLEVEDLVSDANGEVVYHDDSGNSVLTLRSAVPVVAEGASRPHVTAAGDDVTGFRYLTFANGLTLYLRGGARLILEAPDG